MLIAPEKNTFSSLTFFWSQEQSTSTSQYKLLKWTYKYFLSNNNQQHKNILFLSLGVTLHKNFTLLLLGHFHYLFPSSIKQSQQRCTLQTFAVTDIVVAGSGACSSSKSTSSLSGDAMGDVGPLFPGLFGPLVPISWDIYSKKKKFMAES